MREVIERIRGRKLQDIRKRYFAKHQVCQCSDSRCPHMQGYDGSPLWHTKEATILDHIKPLHQGGTNDESNYQGLCEMCHDYKSTTERGNTSKPYKAQGLDWV